MDTELDLTTASRERLLAIIAEQQATIAQLQQRVTALEARLKHRGSPGMPGNKPTKAQQPPRTPGRTPGNAAPTASPAGA